MEVFTLQRQTSTQLSIEFCVNLSVSVSVSVRLGVGQCEHTINAALSFVHIYRFSTVFVSGTFDHVNAMCEQYYRNSFSPF